MSTTSSKILVLEAADAEIVLVAIQESRISAYTPAQRQRLPIILRALGRYLIAPENELQGELTEIRLNQQRKRGRPPLTTR